MLNIDLLLCLLNLILVSWLTGLVWNSCSLHDSLLLVWYHLYQFDDAGVFSSCPREFNSWQMLCLELGAVVALRFLLTICHYLGVRKIWLAFKHQKSRFCLGFRFFLDYEGVSLCCIHAFISVIFGYIVFPGVRLITFPCQVPFCFIKICPPSLTKKAQKWCKVIFFAHLDDKRQNTLYITSLCLVKRYLKLKKLRRNDWFEQSTVC